MSTEDAEWSSCPIKMSILENTDWWPKIKNKGDS